MNRDKTRIWRGGLDALLDREGDERPPATAREPQPAASAPNVGAATRVMPIERLLAHERGPRPPSAAADSSARRTQARDRSLAAQAAAAAAAPALDDEVTEVVASLREARARLWRRGAMVVLAAAIVVLALRPRDAQPPAASVPRARPAATATPAAEASTRAALRPGTTKPAAGTRPVAAKPPPVLATALPASARTAPPGLERRAVDALIAGDREAAAQLYAQLAGAQPQRAVFAEAARILRRRARPQPSGLY